MVGAEESGVSGGGMVTQISGAIEVHPQRLHEFGSMLGDEVHKQVRPQASRLSLVFEDGVTFGRGNPSADLQAAAAAYHACLAGMGQQFETMIAAVAALADSAQQIAARYASSDALASAKAKDVLSTLDAAVSARAGMFAGQPRTGPR